MQNLNWLVLQQWHKEFGKFFTRELESLKIGTLMGFVIQSRKCLSSTFLGDLSVITDLSFQNWHGSKYVWAKKVHGSMIDCTADSFRVWSKTNYCFQKSHEKFGNFSFTG